ncbi:MAG: AAA family ATPase [Candidatus Azobacteroides sp.]|nr:AAA family ATPase [Candidatus Azobacteroides sp.]
MISKVAISNYKSIEKLEIPLSNVNVFIGENGSGKSNILEAVGMACAAQTNQLTTEDLFNRGVRVAKPTLTFNSFINKSLQKEIRISLYTKETEYRTFLFVENENDIFTLWQNEGYNHTNSSPFFTNFVIFNLSTNSLRGFANVSKKEPLGIYGENLDVLLSTFTLEQINEIKSCNFINWLDDFIISDNFQAGGYKLGRSSSKLYFTDKYMQKKNNLFSAENANEGALHVLFYLALFISEKTPAFFAIDNIETALNPYLCRKLMQAITELAVKHNKQVLITTHNPAVLDGLDLNNESQKLFIIKRTNTGRTVAEELKTKPQATEGKYKLSELWMRGFIGGLPTDF